MEQGKELRNRKLSVFYYDEYLMYLVVILSILTERFLFPSITTTKMLFINLTITKKNNA